MLSPDEAGLFQERLHLMDDKINVGLTTLQWSSMEQSKVFLKDCLLLVDKVGANDAPTFTAFCWFFDRFEIQTVLLAPAGVQKTL